MHFTLISDYLCVQKVLFVTRTAYKVATYFAPKIIPLNIQSKLAKSCPFIFLFRYLKSLFTKMEKKRLTGSIHMDFGLLTKYLNFYLEKTIQKNFGNYNVMKDMDIFSIPISYPFILS